MGTVKSGIEGFDECVSGGFQPGSVNLISGGSGTGKTLFALDFILRGAGDSGENGLFITLEENKESILHNLPKGRQQDLELVGKNVWFVDLSTIRTLSTVEEETGQDSSILSVDTLTEIIEQWTSTKHVQRVTVDGMATLALKYGCENEFRSAMFRLTSKMKSLGISAMVTTEVNAPDRISRYGVEEYLVDSITLLTNDSGNMELEVLKVRGQGFIHGKHSFEIDDEGVHVYARLLPQEHATSSKKRAKTGTPGLDEMTNGGFLEGDVTLVSGSPGTGKTILGLKFLADGATKGENGLFISFEENPSQLQRNARNIGVDLELLQKKGLVEIITAAPSTLNKGKHSKELARRLHGVKRVVIDSLTDYTIAIPDNDEYRVYINTMASLFKKNGITAILTAESPELMGSFKITEMGTSFIVDNIILLRYVEIGSEMRRALNILKMRGSNHDKDIREYIITSKGMEVKAKFEGMEGLLSGAPIHRMTKRVQKFFD